ncbi:CD3e molecule, epsilon associated protein isoform X2 [Scyliorhinus canicula]|uniref:CD3e molecule, epsilon associated protein isoform X2 n=1 Tax=Scyliorhinus canicula TaxID=7830 RepID=UPI0018F390B4|nr:CD3e molecule, epsilon associated protein isoform X2 [Scyliorhinus canicula]
MAAAGSGKMTKFECPSEFLPCPRAPLCSLTPEKVNDPSTELWLIKAPADFDPHGFSGRKIPLVGFQTLKSKTYRDKLYNVFGTSGGAEGVSLVLPLEKEGHGESCPPFAGCITIGESWEDPSGSEGLRSIPVSPAPSIPPGLKLRFQPFGAAVPWRLPRKRRGDSAVAPELGDQGEPLAKRRKGANTVAVSGHEPEQEEAAFEHSDTGSVELGHRKREKKRRKHKEAEIPQTVPWEVGHKKKKKKKDKH